MGKYEENHNRGRHSPIIQLANDRIPRYNTEEYANFPQDHYQKPLDPGTRPLQTRSESLFEIGPDDRDTLTRSIESLEKRIGTEMLSIQPGVRPITESEAKKMCDEIEYY